MKDIDNLIEKIRMEIDTKTYNSDLEFHVSYDFIKEVSLRLAENNEAMYALLREVKEYFIQKFRYGSVDGYDLFEKINNLLEEE